MPAPSLYHHPSRGELRWAALFAAAFLALTCLPYLFGLAIKPVGAAYSGFIANPDEHNVYLSLMRQAHDGSFFFRDLFTAEPQAGRVIDVFWLVLGLFAWVTHLPLAVVYHLARVLSGWLLLMAIYCLAAQVLSGLTARRAALVLAATASGLGWLYHAGPGQPNPIDLGPGLIMPEAITFLTLLLNPLFAFSMFLLVVIYLAAPHAFASGSARAAVLAGLAALVLGNIHSYDVIPVVAALAVFLGYTLLTRRGAHVCHPEGGAVPTEEPSQWPSQPHPDTIPEGRPFASLRMTAGSAPPPGRVIACALLIAVIAAPSLLYQLWLQRSGDVSMLVKATNQPPSPEPVYVVLGFGIPLLFAVIGLGVSLRGSDWIRLLALWLVVGGAAVYAPVSFQRKLIEGLHIPIVLFAMVTVERVVMACARVPEREMVAAGTRGTGGTRKRVPERAPPGEPVPAVCPPGSVSPRLLLAAALLVMISLPSDLAFVARAGNDLVSNNMQYLGNLMPPLYLTREEREALDYLSKHVRPSDVLLANSFLSNYAPARAGVRVYFGHWSETPDFVGKVREYSQFLTDATPDAAREAFVRTHGITYVLLDGTRADSDLPTYDGVYLPPGRSIFREDLSPWLERVFDQGSELSHVAIYRVMGR